jgi:FlaA1/EpsC-like NDP-sugar epimerase
MTIPEAAGLVIQSAAYSVGCKDDAPHIAGAVPRASNVFLLDMGEPVNILELAKRFVRAQGLEPDVDIPIHITGIRPGEKLFEELSYDHEDMLPTPHESIRRWHTQAPDTARMKQIIATFDRLRDARELGDSAGSISGGHRWQHAAPDAIIAAIRLAVPEMVPALAKTRAAG